jgi:hypothetical protein
MKKLILLLLFSLINIFYSYSQCLDCQYFEIKEPITYQVNQPNCGTCSYTVFYRACNSIQGSFLIDSIRASSSNPSCCQGTAINDPIVSGFILDKAADTIAQQNGGIVIIYTSSRCWKWEGQLGPGPLHQAVLVPCGTAVSCCIYYYNNGVLTRRDVVGTLECRNDPEGCMPLCE